MTKQDLLNLLYEDLKEARAKVKILAEAEITEDNEKEYNYYFNKVQYIRSLIKHVREKVSA